MYITRVINSYLKLNFTKIIEIVRVVSYVILKCKVIRCCKYASKY